MQFKKEYQYKTQQHCCGQTWLMCVFQVVSVEMSSFPPMCSSAMTSGAMAEVDGVTRGGWGGERLRWVGVLVMRLG